MKIIKGVAFPDADEFMAAELTKDGTYQHSHLAAVLGHVTNFERAIDGGAHVGIWTRALARRFARVIALEPSEDTFEALRFNVQRWRLQNVETYNAALGRTLGRADVALDPVNAARKNTGARHLVYAPSSPVNGVAVLTVDSRKFQSLGLLKLDVEGSEFAALEGSVETLRRCRPVVIFENKGLGEKFYGEPKDAVQGLLKENGYLQVEKVGCDEIWIPG